MIEFVWKPEQICQLFDSLLQGYPFGTFLFWKIKSTHQREYQFYDFMRHYHQRDRVHCEKLDLIGEQDRVAVLDGQQRMTALNIGAQMHLSSVAYILTCWWPVKLKGELVMIFVS